MNLINGKIRVYNYKQSPIGFPSSVNKNGNLVPAREENSEYAMTRILWEDIEEENSKCDIFRTGLLRFNPEEEEEVYQKLGITDKENIKSDKDILKMLTDTTTENLKAINAINSASLLTRMKTMLFDLEKTESNIPHKVITVVNEKYDELRYGGKTNKESFVSKLIEEENKLKEESKFKDMINDLASEVKALKEDKNQSQNALVDLLKMVQDLKAENQQLKVESASTNKNTKAKSNKNSEGEEKTE